MSTTSNIDIVCKYETKPVLPHLAFSLIHFYLSYSSTLSLNISPSICVSLSLSSLMTLLISLCLCLCLSLFICVCVCHTLSVSVSVSLSLSVCVCHTLFPCLAIQVFLSLQHHPQLQHIDRSSYVHLDSSIYFECIYLLSRWTYDVAQVSALGENTS